jgi:hypothetical protein
VIRGPKKNGLRHKGHSGAADCLTVLLPAENVDFLTMFVIPKNNKQRFNPAHRFPDPPVVPFVGANYNTFLKGVKHNLEHPKNHSAALDAGGSTTVYMEFPGSRYKPSESRHADPSQY